MFLVFINNIDAMAHLVTVIKKFADNTKLGHVIRSQDIRDWLSPVWTGWLNGSGERIDQGRQMIRGEKL
jgi:hypothetical protein